jgi:hypothetical protein
MHVIEIAFSKGCHKLQLETNYKFAQGAFRKDNSYAPLQFFYLSFLSIPN